ncbi:DUF305 domain-containing protein [Streptomyces coacervatus]|uniref:DUF305 domain-containing protein n=1 Tax=Streptomyces coacervatus TaxID=647381 RepID=A0ABP7GRS0_9ACTN|nr:DUF305 domain-containing protein [Streptomyces coacervatus]MDF2264982.1 DUF305 domain-containing protein [Streptomyces coacervatus]
MSAIPRTLTRRAVLIAATTTAALVLSACGGGNDDSGSGASGQTSAASSTGADSAAGAHDAQDIAFAQGMIPHHQQAVQMAELAADRASSAQVKDLAARIEKAQDPEITAMTGWLKSWGEDVPTSDSSMSSMSSMPSKSSKSSMPGMGQSGMPGMMNSKHMDELKTMSGKEFDTMFLTMMVEHHKGAVTMATTEKNKGKYAAATSMAGSIVTSQTAEITEMNKLLGKS